MNSVNAASIAERLSVLDGEQARRTLEVETLKADVVALDRRRAQADVEGQLDGTDQSAILRDLLKQRGALLARLDTLAAGLQQGHFERDELAKRLEDAKVAELLAEHERVCEGAARVDDRMVEHIVALDALRKEALALHHRDQDLAEHPLLKSGPKRRPLLRAVSPFAMGVTLHPSVVAQAEARLAERPANGVTV